MFPFLLTSSFSPLLILADEASRAPARSFTAGLLISIFLALATTAISIMSSKRSHRD